MKDKIHREIMQRLEAQEDIKWSVSWAVFFKIYTKAHAYVGEPIHYLADEQMEADFVRGYTQ